VPEFYLAVVTGIAIICLYLYSYRKYIYPEEIAGKDFRLEQLQKTIDRLEKDLEEAKAENARIVTLFLRAQAEHDK
jgi:hypothetical protein